MILQMIIISKPRIIGAIRTAPPHSQFLPSMIMSRLVQARYINNGSHRLRYTTPRSQSLGLCTGRSTGKTDLESWQSEDIGSRRRFPDNPKSASTSPADRVSGMARADAPAHIIKNDRSLLMRGFFRVRISQYEVELLVAKFSKIGRRVAPKSEEDLPAWEAPAETSVDHGPRIDSSPIDIRRLERQRIFPFQKRPSLSAISLVEFHLQSLLGGQPVETEVKKAKKKPESRLESYNSMQNAGEESEPACRMNGSWVSEILDEAMQLERGTTVRWSIEDWE
ncbi:hypothetical protein IW262DRAFT_1299017 [Armillaria fumosa]|nr:hypothetical protein IW262DRAFT_1299017 [Armillaria fumosa]